MIVRQRDDEGLVVKRRGFDAWLVERIRDDDRIERTLFQRLEQVGGKILFDDQLQVRRALLQFRNQAGQQVGADGVNHAEPELSRQRVLALLRDFGQDLRLLKYDIGLVDDLLTDLGNANFVLRTALEQAHVQLFLEFFDRDTERGLADETGLGRLAEVIFLGYRNDVTEFGQSHDCIG